MVAAILATGDEIIHGDTLNTNGHEIAKALSSEGVPLGLHMTCSDKEQELYDCVAFLAQKHDLIFIIGGLGPTSDDCTRFAVARYLNIALIEHQEAIVHINTRLKKAGLAMDRGNRQQALFPEGAQLLPNPHGTAMGCIYKAPSQLFVLLPGPPRECLPMLNQHVLRILQQKSRTQKQLLSWLLFGVAEGETAQMLDDALASVDCKTGYRLDTPYLEFKVRCQPECVAHIKKIIDPLVAPYIISPSHQKASERLRECIERLDAPLMIRDEVTGGLLQTLLQRPSTVHQVFFHKADKTHMYFHLSGLDAYWHPTHDSKAVLRIAYQIQGKSGEETQVIPYRASALVLSFAAEWLSFRILQLINQFH